MHQILHVPYNAVASCPTKAPRVRGFTSRHERVPRISVRLQSLPTHAYTVQDYRLAALRRLAYLFLRMSSMAAK